MTITLRSMYKSGHLYIFTSLKHLMMLLNCTFFGDSFLLRVDTKVGENLFVCVCGGGGD